MSTRRNKKKCFSSSDISSDCETSTDISLCPKPRCDPSGLSSIINKIKNASLSNDCSPEILSSLPTCAISLDKSVCDRYNFSGCNDGCNNCGNNNNCNNNNNCRPRCEVSNECSFKAIVTPATNVKTLYSNSTLVPVTIRRKNKVVTMQFEGFNAQINAAGTAYLTINQSIYNLPQYPTQFTYRVVHNGVAKSSFITIDPNSSDAIQFYLDISGSGAGVNMGDTVIVYGTSITWITQ